MIYKLKYNKNVKKDIKNFSNKEKLKIRNGVRKILENPYPRNINTIKLKTANYFRYRIGRYRILYNIENDTVKILKVGHRKEIYQNL